MKFSISNEPKFENQVSKDFSTSTRQRRRARAFTHELRTVKEQHGSGVYSWAEGVTRNSARLIARKRSKEVLHASN